MIARPPALTKGAATFRVLDAFRKSIRGPTAPGAGNHGGVLVAVSGGQDSLALALAARALCLRGELQGPVTLAHCNHGWAGDCDAAAHVVRFANSLGLPLRVARGRDVPVTEAGARAWRYGALASLAAFAGCTEVLVAHTRTDLAETVLLNLASGAGADGLSAMTWARELAPGSRLLRPLLGVTRADTAGMCADQGVTVWADPYNAEPRFKRNRVRAAVMPMLAAELNPQVERALAQTAHLLRDEADALESISAECIVRAVVVDAVRGRVVVRRQPLRGLHVALRRRVFRHVLACVAPPGAHPYSFAHVAALEALLKAPAGARAPSLQAGAEAVVDGDDCIVLSGGCISSQLEQPLNAFSASQTSDIEPELDAIAGDDIV